MLVLVYVDDLSITSSSEEGIGTKNLLHSNFKIKDLGQMKYFLGIEVVILETGVVLSQQKFVLDLLSEVGMSGCKPLSIPMPHNLKLMPHQQGKDNIQDLCKHLKRYCGLVGKLIYLTMTRPDICFCMQTLSQFMQTPTKAHVAAAMSVVRYLKGTVGLGIHLSSQGNLQLECFCDLD